MQCWPSPITIIKFSRYDSLKTFFWQRQIYSVVIYNFNSLHFCFVLFLCNKQKYHPSRVLTIVYQLVANVFISTLAYKEAKLNTRFRNILGYSIYTAGTFCLIIVSTLNFQQNVFSTWYTTPWFWFIVFGLGKLDLASHGSGSVGAYVVLCLIVALFGLADAFVQGGMVGDLSFMCPEFIQV